MRSDRRAIALASTRQNSYQRSSFAALPSSDLVVPIALPLAIGIIAGGPGSRCHLPLAIMMCGSNCVQCQGPRQRLPVVVQGTTQEERIRDARFARA